MPPAGTWQSCIRSLCPLRFTDNVRGMLFWADTMFFTAGRAECFLLHFSFSPPYALKNAPSVTLRANMSPWYHLNSDFSALRPAIQPLPYNGGNRSLLLTKNPAMPLPKNHQDFSFQKECSRMPSMPPRKDFHHEPPAERALRPCRRPCLLSEPHTHMYYFRSMHFCIL